MSAIPRAPSLLTTGAIAAVAYAIGSGLVNSVMLAVIKYLGSDLHAFEISFFRSIVGFIALLPLVWRTGSASLFHPRRLGLQAVRGTLHAVSMLCFFSAVTMTSLATVSALAFTTPLFTALLAVLILGERVGARRWAGLVVGFAGMLLMLRPGSGTLDIGAFLAGFASILAAGMVISVKRLIATESPLIVTVWGAFYMALFSLIPAIFVWEWPEGMQWFWLIVIGFLGSTVHFLLAKALSLADTTVILPFDFLKLIWTALFGFLFFAEVPDAVTWIGGTIVFVSAGYVAYRERLAMKERRAETGTTG